MITIKFLGGAKKSFSADSVSMDAERITVSELLERLVKTKPPGTPAPDTSNYIIAINGADCTVSGGAKALVHSGDTVTIIPVIHGGAPRLRLDDGRRRAEVYSISGKSAVPLLEDVRVKFPRLAIQAVSKKSVVSKSHLQKILAISYYAHSHGTMIAKRLETDILMRLAGTTQISRAISSIGVLGEGGFLVIAVGPAAQLDRLHRHLESFLDADYFPGVTIDADIKARAACVHSKTPIEDLLVERAAVLF